MSNTRKFFNISTKEETTVDLTSDEIAESEAIATENAKTKYVTDRLIHGKDSDGNSTTYLGIGEQLDQLFHDVDAGKFGADAKTGEWFNKIKAVKDANPKPS
tara:strand:- start:108 stop:413 length:306 start_codon:yes stop_codon:yes gene_type:complete